MAGCPVALRTLDPMNETDERPQTDVWLVVPLYNEAAVIGDVVRHALQTFPNIVCVDDGSSDESAAVAEAAGAHVVRHPVNLGQGAALQTGFEYALSDPAMRYVVTFDADGQHQVSDVLVMLERIRRGDVLVIFGSRFLDERTSPSALKKLVLRLAVAYTNATTKTRLTDAHNGLRVLSRSVTERLDITQNRMAHASELVAQIGGMRIDGHPVPYAEEPVHILYTDYSKAKGQSLWNSINILAELILR
jgi:polyprenyl-phospho-N-acetylgalactosaminyl synthase